MQYVYKQTGVIVESSLPLDSALYAPVEEKKQTAAKAAAPKKTTAKRTAKAEK